jgi:hypothetical protein
MRFQAVAMSAAQGQPAWFISCRFRAPRVIRAAACRRERPRSHRTHAVLLTATSREVSYERLSTDLRVIVTHDIPL